jgi:hypothetical protein
MKSNLQSITMQKSAEGIVAESHGKSVVRKRAEPPERGRSILGGLIPAKARTVLPAEWQE